MSGNHKINQDGDLESALVSTISSLTTNKSNTFLCSVSASVKNKTEH